MPQSKESVACTKLCRGCEQSCAEVWSFHMWASCAKEVREKKDHGPQMTKILTSFHLKFPFDSEKCTTLGDSSDRKKHFFLKQQKLKLKVKSWPSWKSFLNFYSRFRFKIKGCDFFWESASSAMLIKTQVYMEAKHRNVKRRVKHHQGFRWLCWGSEGNLWSSGSKRLDSLFFLLSSVSARL